MYYPVPGPSSPAAAPTQAIPAAPGYRRPAWADVWEQPPKAGRSGVLAGGLALLVAAMITTVVLLTQGNGSQPPARAGAGGGQTQLPPVPPPTSNSTSTERITPAPATTASAPVPETAGPETAGPETTARAIPAPPTTTSNATVPLTSEQQVPPPPWTTHSPVESRREAEQVAAAWADAVTSGDTAGVRALSCEQDLGAYDSGEMPNPASLAGRFTLTFERVIIAMPYGMAYFTVAPAVDGKTSLTSFLTSTSGQWEICMTVSDAEDL